MLPNGKLSVSIDNQQNEEAKPCPTNNSTPPDGTPDVNGNTNSVPRRIPFAQWIGELNLGNISTIEAKVNQQCVDIVRRTSPQNIVHYNAVLQGHLLLEVWTQIVRAIEESFVTGMYYPNCTITNNGKGSPTNERRSIRIIVPADAPRGHEGPTYIPNNSFILLLWNQPNSPLNLQPTSPNESNLSANRLNPPHCKSPTISIRNVEFASHCCVQIASSRFQEMENTLSLTPMLNQNAWTSLSTKIQTYGSTMTVVPITNLVAFEREYNAVFHVDKMPLARYLFMNQTHLQKQVQDPVCSLNLWRYIERTQGACYYRQHMNPSQFRALQSALIQPLQLIHGPPGTGKTRCVLLPVLKCAFNGLQRAFSNLNMSVLSHASSMIQKASTERLSIPRNIKKKKAIRKLQQQYLQRVEHNKFAAVDHILQFWRRPRLGVFAGSNQAVDQIISSVVEINQSPRLMPFQRYCEIQMGRIGNEDNMTQNIAQINAINLNYSVDFYLSMRWDLESGFQHPYWRYNVKGGPTKEKTTLKLLKNTSKELGALKVAVSDSITAFQHGQLDYQRFSYLIDSCYRKILESQCLDILLHSAWLGQARKKIEVLFMSHTVCLFSTANYIGKYDNRKVRRFDLGLFDECCQMHETQTLVAFQYCHRAVLIGDPKQLQSTVFYNGPHRPVLQQSLFHKLQKQHQPLLLDEQYRMHPEIAKFPSNHFYDGKLKNGRSCNIKTKHKSFHQDPSGLFVPYLFIDIEGAHLESRGYSALAPKSLLNRKECIEVGKQISKFMQSNGGAFLKEIKNIGIITPYSAQKQLISDNLGSKIEELRQCGVTLEVVTVDEFQGSERDIIILSCVRSNGHENIGFLANAPRLNVALTRAKHSLWIFGNARCLQNNKMWNSLIMDAHRRGLFRSKTYPKSTRIAIKKKKIRPQITSKLTSQTPALPQIPNIAMRSKAELKSTPKSTTTKSKSTTKTPQSQHRIHTTPPIVPRISASISNPPSPSSRCRINERLLEEALNELTHLSVTGTVGTARTSGAPLSHLPPNLHPNAINEHALLHQQNKKNVSGPETTNQNAYVSSPITPRSVVNAVGFWSNIYPSDPVLLDSATESDGKGECETESGTLSTLEMKTPPGFPISRRETILKANRNKERGQSAASSEKNKVPVLSAECIIRVPHSPRSSSRI